MDDLRGMPGYPNRSLDSMFDLTNGSGCQMKSAEDILAEANNTFAHMHKRPQMYVRATDVQSAGEIYDGMMWVAHWFWAKCQDREDEFGKTKSNVMTSRKCGCVGFPASYRQRNPDCSEHAVFEYVRECWAEIDAQLGIDISLPDSDV